MNKKYALVIYQKKKTSYLVLFLNEAPAYADAECKLYLFSSFFFNIRYITILFTVLYKVFSPL